MSNVYKVTFYVGAGKQGEQFMRDMEVEAKKRELIGVHGQPALSALIKLAVSRLIAETKMGRTR